MDLVLYECPVSQHCLLKGTIFSHCVFSHLYEFPSWSSSLSAYICWDPLSYFYQYGSIVKFTVIPPALYFLLGVL